MDLREKVTEVRIVKINLSSLSDHVSFSVHSSKMVHLILYLSCRLFITSSDEENKNSGPRPIFMSNTEFLLVLLQLPFGWLSSIW